MERLPGVARTALITSLILPREQVFRARKSRSLRGFGALFPEAAGRRRSAAAAEPFEELRCEIRGALAGLHGGRAKRPEARPRPRSERPHEDEREHEHGGDSQRD